MREPEFTDQTGAILRALGITTVLYSLNGSGDSGETTLERVEYESGKVAHELPDVPVAIGDSGLVYKLPDLLENIVADAPQGDWVNNEGGYGSVTVMPFEDEDDLYFECDMTFRDEGDYGDDDDDFVDEDEDDDEEPDDADGNYLSTTPAVLPDGGTVQ